MRYLPREVDPLVYNMSHEDPGDVTYSAIGGLSEQIRELREVRTDNIQGFLFKPKMLIISSFVLGDWASFNESRIIFESGHNAT